MISILDFFADFLFITSTAVVFSASAEKTFQFQLLKDYRAKKLLKYLLHIVLKTSGQCAKNSVGSMISKSNAFCFPFLFRIIYTRKLSTLLDMMSYTRVTTSWKQKKCFKVLKIFVLKCCPKTK